MVDPQDQESRDYMQVAKISEFMSHIGNETVLISTVL